jgi:predicted transcriptional regulator/RNase P subunit RPR2
MILILACNNCHRTNAVEAVTESMNLPPKETYLIWECLRCRTHHRWLIPRGRGLKNTALQSLKNSIAYRKGDKRMDIYKRLADAQPAAQQKILFGELIRRWREEAGLTQEEAVALTEIDIRQWRRIEAGESKPRRGNLDQVVSAVGGIKKQAYLIVDQGKVWDSDLERRLAEAEEQISSSAHSYMVYQEYWERRQSAPITIDDNSIEVIPTVKEIIDILDRCENRETQLRVIDVMAKEVVFFMTKPQIADLVTQFLNTGFISGLEEHETHRRIGEQWNQSSAMEKLILTLFDIVDSQKQSRLIESCQKLQSSAKETNKWFSE